MTRDLKEKFGVPSISTVDYAHIYSYDAQEINPSELFNPYLNNRGGSSKAIDKHVLEIADAIKKNGNMDDVPPIIVDINTLTIADGNCRFNALLKVLSNNCEGHYVLRVMYENIPTERFDDRVIELNQGQKSWTTLDFIINLSKRGSESHKRLIEFCNSETTLHAPDKIKPRYAAAALGISTSMLKKSSLVLTDEDVERGKKVAFEAAQIRSKFSEDAKANGGGWYESYLAAWADFRSRIESVPFKDYLREVGIAAKSKKRDCPVPFGSNRKSDWSGFFSNVYTHSPLMK